MNALVVPSLLCVFFASASSACGYALSNTGESSTVESQWPKRSRVYYYIDADIPEHILTEKFVGAVQRAFDELQKASCDDAPRFIYGGLKKINPNYNENCTQECTLPAKGAIIISVKTTAWTDRPSFIGITRSYYIIEKKRTVGAIIFLNFSLYHFSDPGEEPADNETYSLQWMLTHEAAHAIGFEHHHIISRENVLNKHLAPGTIYEGLSGIDKYRICPTKDLIGKNLHPPP